jgi:hypothetical protein
MKKTAAGSTPTSLGKTYVHHPSKCTGLLKRKVRLNIGMQPKLFNLEALPPSNATHIVDLLSGRSFVESVIEETITETRIRETDHMQDAIPGASAPDESIAHFPRHVQVQDNLEYTMKWITTFRGGRQMKRAARKRMIHWVSVFLAVACFQRPALAKTVEELTNIVKSGICRAGMETSKDLSYEQHCGQRKYQWSCQQEVDRINKEIYAYNDFVHKCRDLSRRNGGGSGSSQGGHSGSGSQAGRGAGEQQGGGGLPAETGTPGFKACLERFDLGSCLGPLGGPETHPPTGSRWRYCVGQQTAHMNACQARFGVR